MKFTKVPTNTFQQIQLNAGILLKDFDPSDGSFDTADMVGATTGGVTFNGTPEYTDFGEDIDNVPPNTKELKRVNSYTAEMTGSFVTISADAAKMLVGAAELDGTTGKVTPSMTIKSEDFEDIWWVGDYSDTNDDSVSSGATAGFVAIHLMNSLSTGGFQIQSANRGKGQFSFTFTGHYSLNDQDTVPFEIYIKAGEDEDATLSALSLSDMTLTPTFASGTTSYTSSTTSSTNTLTATTTDNSATKEIKLDGNAVTGTTITWGSSGSHTLTVKVTKGNATKTYTITVTKS